MQVYSNGVPIEGHIYEDDTVYYIEQYMQQFGYDPTTISFDLAEMKRWKSREIKKRAGDYLEEVHGRVQIVFTVAKHHANQALSLREQAAWPSIRDNYAHRDSLLDQIDAATNWKACRDGIVWAPVA